MIAFVGPGQGHVEGASRLVAAVDFGTVSIILPSPPVIGCIRPKHGCGDDSRPTPVTSMSYWAPRPEYPIRSGVDVSRPLR
jgi:hypothetical protein